MLTTFAMIAFAGNSLLCRLALKNTGIDAASFSSIRLLSGAIVLYLIIYFRPARQAQENQHKGDWVSAMALFAYVAGFSFAYQQLSAATGALLLFASVQVSMIGYGIWSGERLRGLQLIGSALAFLGLCALLLPGLSAPPVVNAMLMIAAGIAWGIYSLRGRAASDATAVTAGNFLRAVPFALVLSLLSFKSASLDTAGILHAICSGAVASGIGYAIWYTALPSLKAASAASVQLSVPLIAAFGGILLLDEQINMRLAIASVAILGGIALVIFEKAKKPE
ncbi:MAG: DMT family transporter [Arenimonas sp.]